MARNVIGLCFAATSLVLLGFLIGNGRVFAGPERSSRNSSEFPSAPAQTLVTTQLADGQRVLVVFDANSMRMAAYTIQEKGGIKLHGVRNCTWDFGIDEFNETKPSPNEVRSMLKDR